MSAPHGIIERVAAPFLGVVNRTRLGFPRRYFAGTGLLGDDLMCTAVFRELKKRSKGRIAFSTRQPELFLHNADVDFLLTHKNAGLARWSELGLPIRRLAYTTYDATRDYDEPPKEHALIHMFRLAGLTGLVELRPYLFLTPEELAAGKLAEQQVVIQSSNAASPAAMRNKEWYPDRIQEVASMLRHDVTVIQLGDARDVKLEGAVDLRGKTTLRESAAILANSLVCISLVTFLMHLARAVDCRSVIIYGGREKPSQTGYVANRNLYSQVRCAPCWLRNPCDYERKCMDQITPRHVIAAVAEQIARHRSLLEVQTAQL